MKTHADFPWYTTFVSILFGFSLSVWGKAFCDTLGSKNTCETMILGILMFFILVCLWWWYAMFIGHTDPAHGLHFYTLDFVALASFAVAANFWTAKHSELTIFYKAVPFAIFIMLIRFASVWFRSPSGSKEKKILSLVYTVLFVNFLFIVLGAIYTSGHNASLLILSIYTFCMLLGIFITVVAAWIYENWFSQKYRPVVNTLHNKLLFANAPVPKGVSADQIADAIKTAVKAREDFHGILGAKNRSVHLSSVHTEDDTCVQALILSLPSLPDSDTMYRKAFLTYAGHWVDDYWDKNPPKKLKKCQTADDVCEYTTYLDKATAVLTTSLLEKTAHNPFQNFGLKRLLIGSVLFTSEKEGQIQYREIHHEMLSGYLSPDFYKECESNVGVSMIDLTCKTIQEMWMGLETPVPKFDLMFLYSILFGPALYYHDRDQEVDAGELSESTSFGEKKAEETIQWAGKKIKTFGEEEPMRSMRAWQIESLALSFAEFLPPTILNAYLKAAETIRT